MTQSKKPSKKTTTKATKPLHIEIHGDGVDIVATFQGSDKDDGQKTKDNAWEKLFQYLTSNVKVTETPAPVAAAIPPDGQAHRELGVEDAVYIIRVATAEDLEVIHAAIRARAMNDAKEDAAKAPATA